MLKIRYFILLKLVFPMKKFQNMEAIIVVFVLIFVLMVLIPRCRQTPAAAPEATVAPIPTPQALPPVAGTTPPDAPATETPTPAAVVAPAVVPTPAPAAVVAAPVAAAEKVSSPEAFAKKLTPKPMANPTKRAPQTAASAQEETVPFNPNGGGNAAEGGREITFYTVVSDVKMRAQPGLDSKIIGKLPKDMAVTYLNVRTDKTQKLTIDNTPYDEPWLKIRTKKGTIGWVYGGTVRAYKK
jgi:hypothetical protein